MTFKRPPLCRKWSESEDEELRCLAKTGATLLRATAALNRRENVIRKRARELGLCLVGMREAKRRIRLLTEREANDDRSPAHS
ncbi:hypothetical protein [Rhodopseudomonas sp. P2A-2r]|uniref:hypothetical protein n=1 Tax=unclassified Rhodopseudomonas TaxID=2638247 RepID=UPI0022341FB7|nr:hypothetical protein [Rhodopseudomonas sp. P2A-2r]UZE50160.1 hypothetical protein ONR75_05270 [Rhodopseudomonas sp. P2A-2r]